MKQHSTYPILTTESETVEFKSTFQDEVIISLVAFANTKGGVVYVGVDDQGEGRGVSIGKETVQKWLNEIKLKTQPSLVPEVDILQQQERQVVMFSSPSYPIKPVSYKGKYYKRISNANHPMSASEIAQMHLRTVNSSWDYHWRHGKTIDDIAVDKVQHLIDVVTRRNPEVRIDTVAQFLQKQELVHGTQISNGCYLLFCNEDSHHTTIQMGHFASETVIKDDVTTSKDIIAQVDEVMSFVTKHINKEIIITGEPENTERWQYPLEGLRELIVNMIVHRDYTSGIHSTVKVFPDSIVFYNSGSLPNHITIDKLLSDDYVSFPRNLQIAKIFKEMGLIERYGSGIKRVRELFLNHGLPEPEFKLIQEGFFVRVFATSENVTENVTDTLVMGGQKGGQKAGLSDNQLQILNAMEVNNYISRKELSEMIGIAQSAIQRHISTLKDKGLLERIGPAKGGYWKVLRE